MKIQVDTLYLQQAVYQMLRNLNDGVYVDHSNVCRGMLDAEQTAALDDFIRELEEAAQ